jgi:hypothetical protein
MLVVEACRGGRASLQQVQVVAWAALFASSDELFLKVYRGEVDPSALLIRYDPAITRAIDLAVGLALLKWVNGKRLELTDSGKALIVRIRANEQILAPEQDFLSGLGTTISMKRINEMIER